MRVRMDEIAVAMFVNMKSVRWIEGAMRMLMRLFGMRRSGFTARFHEPERRGDGGENSKENPSGLSEPKRRGKEAGQRISKPPSRVAEREVRSVNVRAFLARAVGREQLVAANAEDTLRRARKRPADEQRRILLKDGGKHQRQQHGGRARGHEPIAHRRRDARVAGGRAHCADPVGGHGPRIRSIGKPEPYLDEIDRRHEHERAHHAHLQGQEQRFAQGRSLKHRGEAVAKRGLLSIALLWFKEQPWHAKEQRGADEKGDGINYEVSAESHHRDDDSRERWAEDIRRIVGNGTQGERPWILLLRDDAGDDGLVNWREERRAEIQDHGERVNLPDGTREKEADNDYRAHDIATDQNRPRTEALRDLSCPRRAKDDDDDADGECHAKHGRGGRAHELVCQ